MPDQRKDTGENANREVFSGHRLDIARVANHLAIMGWCEGNAGNISLLLPRGEYTPEDHPQASMPLPEPVRPLAGRTILITTSGSRFRRMMIDRETDIVPVTVSRFGNSILWPEDFRRPSSEISTHLQVLALAEGRGWPSASIVHTHSTSMLALSSSDLPGETLEDAMWRAHPELSQLLENGLRFLDFQTPGTWELGKCTAELFSRSDVVIWRKHGILAFGSDPETACDYVELAEKAAVLLLMEMNAFGRFQGLKDRELRVLRDDLARD